MEKLEGGLDVSSKVGGGSSEQERDSNAIGLSDEEDFRGGVHRIGRKTQRE